MAEKFALSTLAVATMLSTPSVTVTTNVRCTAANCPATAQISKFWRTSLQALAQALDVFIVQLVLLLVHLQQRPQAFDAMLFPHHTLSVFKLAYNSPVSGCFHRFTGFYVCVWLNVVLGVGGKLFGLH